MMRLSRRHRAALFALALFGFWVLRRNVGEESLHWMVIYLTRDFEQLSLRQTLLFYRDLRTGIPPLISALEIADLRFISDRRAWIVVGPLYRGAWVMSYLLALRLAPRPLEFWIGLGLSVVFLIATSLLHPLNPQVYDAFYPLMVLGFMVCLEQVRANEAV